MANQKGSSQNHNRVTDGEPDRRFKENRDGPTGQGQVKDPENDGRLKENRDEGASKQNRQSR
ncbi:MAG: hypothetical protein NW215_09685 [Hyphomicrobiales bacterium]|nr:hypothetical protein [Hyphomicrobiales bacterium]